MDALTIDLLTLIELEGGGRAAGVRITDGGANAGGGRGVVVTSAHRKGAPLIGVPVGVLITEAEGESTAWGVAWRTAMAVSASVGVSGGGSASSGNMDPSRLRSGSPFIGRQYVTRPYLQLAMLARIERGGDPYMASLLAGGSAVGRSVVEIGLPGVKWGWMVDNPNTSPHLTSSHPIPSFLQRPRATLSTHSSGGRRRGQRCGGRTSRWRWASCRVWPSVRTTL